jgi:hypothetical protein
MENEKCRMQNAECRIGASAKLLDGRVREGCALLITLSPATRVSDVAGCTRNAECTTEEPDRAIVVGVC